MNGLERSELQKMIRSYKKSGPETPAYIPNDSDAIRGDDPLNPLKKDLKT